MVRASGVGELLAVFQTAVVFATRYPGLRSAPPWAEGCQSFYEERRPVNHASLVFPSPGGFLFSKSIHFANALPATGNLLPGGSCSLVPRQVGSSFYSGSRPGASGSAR